MESPKYVWIVGTFSAMGDPSVGLGGVMTWDLRGVFPSEAEALMECQETGQFVMRAPFGVVVDDPLPVNFPRGI